MEAFEKLVSLLDYPMFVVTTSADGRSAGCLVGFASQVSIGPPRFLVGLSKRNHTYRVAQHAGFLLEPVAGQAPDRFEQLVTFADVADLDPGHRA